MRITANILTIIQSVIILTFAKSTINASIPCTSGSTNGEIMYERIPNMQIQSSESYTFKSSSPPAMVMELCEILCLQNRTYENTTFPCSSFSFNAGNRNESKDQPEYGESTCYLNDEQPQPEGSGILLIKPNTVLFNKVCITSDQPKKICPNRQYIFERHPFTKLSIGLGAYPRKEVLVSTRIECEDKCLNESSFVCRSAIYTPKENACVLTTGNRRGNTYLVDNQESEYLENTCLSVERRCHDIPFFIKEENKSFNKKFEVEALFGISLEACQRRCINSDKYLCRSIGYDDKTKTCTLSEDDSISQKDELVFSSSYNFYELVCLETPLNRSSRFNFQSSIIENPITAFQKYTNSRLEIPIEKLHPYPTISLGECLNLCLKWFTLCRSAEYHKRFNSCMLTESTQKGGSWTIYDPSYDYYEIPDETENLRTIEFNNVYTSNIDSNPIGRENNTNNLGGVQQYPLPVFPNIKGSNNTSYATQENVLLSNKDEIKIQDNKGPTNNNDKYPPGGQTLNNNNKNGGGRYPLPSNIQGSSYGNNNENLIGREPLINNGYGMGQNTLPDNIQSSNNIPSAQDTYPLSDKDDERKPENEKYSEDRIYFDEATQYIPTSSPLQLTTSEKNRNDISKEMLPGSNDKISIPDPIKQNNTSEQENFHRDRYDQLTAQGFRDKNDKLDTQYAEEDAYRNRYFNRNTPYLRLPEVLWGIPLIPIQSFLGDPYDYNRLRPSYKIRYEDGRVGPRGDRESIKQTIFAKSLRDCEQACKETRDFICRSIKYKRSLLPSNIHEGNCILTDEINISTDE